VSTNLNLTVGQLANLLGAPQWRIRRVVDSLECEVPRAGLYRLVPRNLIPAIAERLSTSKSRVNQAKTRVGRAQPDLSVGELTQTNHVFGQMAEENAVMEVHPENDLNLATE
jgi:hypothetical protein